MLIKRGIPFLLFITSLVAGYSQKNSHDSIYSFRPHSPDGTGKFYMGREIAFVMGAAGSEWLERNERQQEENTSLAIEK